MALPCSNGPFRALFRVFVTPSVSSPSTNNPALLTRPLRSVYHITATRNLTTKSKNPPVPVQRQHKFDNEITARQIYLVDENGKLSDQPYFTRRVLQNLDLKTHRLVQLSSGERPVSGRTSGRDNNDEVIPLCRVWLKKELFATEKRREQEAKAARRLSRRTSEAQSKILELNWAIDANDLEHRLRRMREFLAEGRCVDIVLAAKKRGRVASPEESKRVLARLREAVEEVPGAREKAGSFEGTVGKVVRLTLLGRPLSAQALTETGKAARRTDGGDRDGEDGNRVDGGRDRQAE